jgi:opacity protein-like surface antigen
MMRGLRLMWALVFVGLLASGASLAEGDVNVFLGQRLSSDSDLEDAGVDSPPQYGLAVSLEFDWPVALAVDVMASSDDDRQDLSGMGGALIFDTDIDTFEFDAGVRKFWGEKLRPYVGGGVAWVALEAKQTMVGDLGVPGTEFFDVIVDDSDSGIGYWLNGGVTYTIGSSFNVGADLRYTDSDVTLRASDGSGDIDLGAGGWQYGLLLGFHW